jgi:glycosyltransferase involved in cell wall biosynthesis
MEALGVPVHQVRLGRIPAVTSVWDARRLLRQWRPDLVISFLYQSNMMVRLAGRLARVPVIVSSIRNEQFGGRAREVAMRVTDRLATVTTVNSRLAADALVQRGVVRRHRMVVVPNGLDPSMFVGRRRAETRATLGVNADEFLWFGAGRLQPQKDWRTLLSAVAALPSADRARGRWVIAGEGPQYDELVLQAKTLGVDDRVTFLGPRGDVPDLLSACDAVVLTSVFEGLPNVVLEAMAAKRPIVATRVGGVPELVDDGGTGDVVAPSDPAAIAGAMSRMMQRSDDARAEMGERAHRLVLEQYTVDSVMTRWCELLDSLAPESGPRRGGRSGRATGFAAG